MVTNTATAKRCDASGSNGVIAMLRAHYGRMKFGRCIQEEPDLAAVMENPKFLGCSADVRHIVDRQCSGRTECSIRINDQSFEGIKPCYANLKMYMEASYSCIQGNRSLPTCYVSTPESTCPSVEWASTRDSLSFVACPYWTEPLKYGRNASTKFYIDI